MYLNVLKNVLYQNVLKNVLSARAQPPRLTLDGAHCTGYRAVYAVAGAALQVSKNSDSNKSENSGTYYCSPTVTILLLKVVLERGDMAVPIHRS
jgi:hypothetical protein